MPNSYNGVIEYFFHEGKENLEDCLRIAFETAVSRDVKTIVIFTGIGQGPRIAIEKYLSQPRFKEIQLIAVTFPYGQRFKDGAHIEISPKTLDFLVENGVPLLRAHLPFAPIAAHYRQHGILGQDLTLIGNALSIFGGSMSLCVQAALVASDAGYLELGQHAICLTSDTAILARTSPTQDFLTDFIVREILCKPMALTVVKHEKRLTPLQEPTTVEISGGTTPVLLPPESGDQPSE
ncbi:MAG TPA: hypothetical protein VGE85_15500 [Terracidiphilus sp.]|jgi:hypothetical protein